MKNIALTGGIACGKSMLSDALAELGAHVIDTDLIARELVEPTQPALQEIQAILGDKVIDASGTLNRSVLRQIIATDKSARETLNHILHPKIQSSVHARTVQPPTNAAYNLIVVPLLTENLNAYDWVDLIVVVDCSPETQLSRLKTRDNQHDETTLKAMIAAQSTREARLAIADIVVANETSTDSFLAQVPALHQRLIDFPIKQ